MADYEASTRVDAPAGQLFDYLADPHNLTAYVTRLSAAEPLDDDLVRVTADRGGAEVSGDAWVRVDADARSLAWGLTGSDDYSGQLEVREDGPASVVTVRVRTVRAARDQVRDGVDGTLRRIKELMEAG
ncbi:MAG: SRPBCC family protein [Mycobacterium leprae]